MKRKYMMLFLMGLLCLVGNIDLFSQHCIKMSYDKNGNRIIFKVEDCTKYVRGEADAVGGCAAGRAGKAGECWRSMRRIGRRSVVCVCR